MNFMYTPVEYSVSEYLLSFRLWVIVQLSEVTMHQTSSLGFGEAEKQMFSTGSLCFSEKRQTAKRKPVFIVGEVFYFKILNNYGYGQYLRTNSCLRAQPVCFKEYGRMSVVENLVFIDSVNS